MTKKTLHSKRPINVTDTMLIQKDGRPHRVLINCQCDFYIYIQIQIQLYWPGLRTNKEFDFGPLALYVQHLQHNTQHLTYC